MRILRFFGKFFGGFLIFLALTIVFTGLFTHYSIDNIGVLTKSAETKIPEIMQENKEVFAEALFKNPKINRAQLKQVCLQKPEELSEEFCNKLDSMESEEEVKSELVDVMIAKTQEQFMPEVQDLERELKFKLEGVKFLNYSNYTIPVGIAVFLLGVLLIFLAEKFRWKAALFYVGIKVGVMSALASVANFYIKNLTPEKFESVAKTLPMFRGEEGSGLAIKLVSALLIDWVTVVTGKLFVVSALIAIISLATAVVMFILKRKKSVRAVKVEEKAEVKKEEKKVVKKAPAVKRKPKRVLFSKKEK